MGEGTTEVNVTELRQHLRRYLAQARSGQHIRVTARGRVIAELRPASPAVTAVAAARARLRDSVVRFDDPVASILPANDWDLNR